MKRTIKGEGKGCSRAAPIYELAHGIKIISERPVGPYIYCTLEKHKLFPRAKANAAGRIVSARSRVVMTANLGRALKQSEHVHHKNKRRKRDDSLANLELLSAAEHNRLHKTGTKHKKTSKEKIAEGVKRAYADGRHVRHRLFGKDNPFFGKTHTAKARAKISEARKKNPIYMLGHGIQVISEHKTVDGVVWRILPHRLFAGKIFGRTMNIRRARIIMTIKLGRRLKKSEHVYHGKRGLFCDRLSNLSLQTRGK